MKRADAVNNKVVNMAANVNSVKSFEFVKTERKSANEAKHDATSSHDPLETGDQQYLKEEVDLDWEPSVTDTNGSAANKTTGTIDTIALEDIPIIILQQPNQPVNGDVNKKKSECRICHKIFQDDQILQKHLEQCQIIGCPLCNFKTFDNASFKKHWNIHTLSENHVATLDKKLKPLVTYTEVKEIPLTNLDCPNCEKIFKTKTQLYLHIFKCEKLHCIHCDFTTFKTTELKQHFQKMHLKPEEKIRVCPRCNKTLKNAHSLSTHRWMCGKKPRCECHDCGYKTFNKYNLRAHILAKHMQPKIQKIVSPTLPQPENATTEQVSVAPIIVNDQQSTEQVCKICDRTFSHQRALRAHSKHCKLYQCNHCLYESFRKAYLKKHIKASHKITFVPHEIEPQILAVTERMCEICYEIFQNANDFQSHALYCREYKCTHCPYKTHIEADLANHTLRKHERNNLKNECPKCGKTYKNRDVVLTHLQYCGNPYTKCDHCPFKSNRPGVLKSHIASAHSAPLELEEEIDPPVEEPTLVCDKCGEKLKEYQTMSFHSFYCPKKPFLECNMCPFKTRYGLCLKNHILRVHCQSNLESYECPKCSGRLKTQETFKRHLFSCIPETVLRCSLCSYMTRDPSCLSDHVLDKHYKPDQSEASDTKLIPCPKCGTKVKNPLALRSHLQICEKDSRS